MFSTKLNLLYLVYSTTRRCCLLYLIKKKLLKTFLGTVISNIGERCTVKSTALLVFFVVIEVFEKLVNNRLVDHLEKYGLFCYLQYGFSSSRSIGDLLIVVSDRIARAFNRSRLREL